MKNSNFKKIIFCLIFSCLTLVGCQGFNGISSNTNNSSSSNDLHSTSNFETSETETKKYLSEEEILQYINNIDVSKNYNTAKEEFTFKVLDVELEEEYLELIGETEETYITYWLEKNGYNPSIVIGEKYTFDTNIGREFGPGDENDISWYLESGYKFSKKGNNLLNEINYCYNSEQDIYTGIYDEVDLICSNLSYSYVYKINHKDGTSLITSETIFYDDEFFDIKIGVNIETNKIDAFEISDSTFTEKELSNFYNKILNHNVNKEVSLSKEEGTAEKALENKINELIRGYKEFDLNNNWIPEFVEKEATVYRKLEINKEGYAILDEYKAEYKIFTGDKLCATIELESYCEYSDFRDYPYSVPLGEICYPYVAFKEINDLFIEMIPTVEKVRWYYPDQSKEYSDKVKTIYLLEEGQKKLYAYELEVEGFRSEINFIVILSEDGQLIRNLKILWHSEIYGGTLLDSPEFSAQFVNLPIINLEEDVDFVAGSTATYTFNAVISGVQEAIEAHYQLILDKQILDELTLNEQTILNIDDNEQVSLLTEEMQKDLKESVSESKYNSLMSTFEELYYMEYKEKETHNTKKAYIFSKKYNCEVEYGYREWKKVKIAVVLSNNTDKVEIVVLSSTDSLTQTGRDSIDELINENFNNKSLEEIYCEEVDIVAGATFTSNAIIDGIRTIALIHRYITEK